MVAQALEVIELPGDPAPVGFALGPRLGLVLLAHLEVVLMRGDGKALAARVEDRVLLALSVVGERRQLASELLAGIGRRLTEAGVGSPKLLQVHRRPLASAVLHHPLSLGCETKASLASPDLLLHEGRAQQQLTPLAHPLAPGPCEARARGADIAERSEIADRAERIAIERRGRSQLFSLRFERAVVARRLTGTLSRRGFDPDVTRRALEVLAGE